MAGLSRTEPTASHGTLHHLPCEHTWELRLDLTLSCKLFTAAWFLFLADTIFTKPKEDNYSFKKYLDVVFIKIPRILVLGPMVSVAWGPRRESFWTAPHLAEGNSWSPQGGRSHRQHNSLWSWIDSYDQYLSSLLKVRLTLCTRIKDAEWGQALRLFAPHRLTNQKFTHACQVGCRQPWEEGVSLLPSGLYFLYTGHFHNGNYFKMEN